MKDQDAQHIVCDASPDTMLHHHYQGRHSSSPLSEGQTIEVTEKFKSASEEVAWGFRRRVWIKLSHCSSWRSQGVWCL